MGAGFCPSLRSIRATPGVRHFFVVTLRSPPQRLTSLRLGTNSAGLCPPWNLFLAAVQSSCSGGSALLRCHASPAHDARLPSVSGQPWQAPPALHGYPSLQSIRAVRDGSDASSLSRLVSHRVSPSADGEIKTNPVFSGDMRLGKHSAHGKEGDFFGTKSSPLSHAAPSKKSLDFFEKVRDGSDASSKNKPRIAANSYNPG